MKTAAIVGFLLMSSSPAMARVFDLRGESFAAYLLGSYGPSAIGDSVYASESSATEFSEEWASNYSGEFGFIYARGAVSWRFGFEFMKPLTLKDIVASNGGATQYKLQSSVLGVMPKIGIEFNLKTMVNWRVFVSAYAGQTSLTVTNDYSDVTIAPNTDFTMKYKGNAMTQGGALGVEMSAFDTTTVVIEAGYRRMMFETLLYAADVPDGFQGAASSGDSVLRVDGDKRTIDFSGAYVTFGARFYLF